MIKYQFIDGLPQPMIPPDQVAVALRHLIDGRANNLKKYAKRPDAKDAYIDRESQFLNQLIAVYNNLCDLPSLALWIDIEAEMKRLLKVDSSLNGFIISMKTGQGENNFASISIRSYPFPNQAS